MDRFILKFLWLEKAIAVALDQKVGDRTNPITEYFFWPRKDAWEEMRLDLENKTWVSQADSIVILNKITEVINFWQENSFNNNVDLEKVRTKFKDCTFIGYN